MNRGRVNVVLRVKPLDDGRVSDNVTVVDSEMGGASVILKKSKKTEDLFQYRFYRALEKASQLETYKVCGEEVINSCLEGYNGTIIAYGQTGSGKTHTMFGPDGIGVEDVELHGIMPRAIEHVFSAVQRCLEWTVKMTYVEVYNETFRDLLSKSRNPISVLDGTSKSRGTTSLKGCTPIILKSKSHAFNLLLKGQESRSVAAHAMNDRSSRSHAIVTLWIQVTDDDGRTQKSKLNMVDLAGSERVRKTNAAGSIAKEATYINKSLSCLSLVAKELRKKASHVRYRDSKLTHYLKDSIGGNCRTLMVACVWGNSSNFGESLSTCRFADDIQNVEVTASKNGGMESVHGKLFKMNPAMTKYIEQMMEKRVAQEKAKMFRNLKKRGLVTTEADDVDTFLDQEDSNLATKETSELELLREKVRSLEESTRQSQEEGQEATNELESLRQTVEQLETEKKEVQEEMSKQMKDAECNLLEELQELRLKVSELQKLRALTQQECIELYALRERMAEVASRSFNTGLEKSYHTWHPSHNTPSFPTASSMSISVQVVNEANPEQSPGCWESVEQQARVVGELEGLRDRLKQLHDVALEKLSQDNFEELTQIRNEIIKFQKEQVLSNSRCFNENEGSLTSRENCVLEELEYMKNRLRALHSIPVDELKYDDLQELAQIKHKISNLQNDEKVRSILRSREVERSRIEEDDELTPEVRSQTTESHLSEIQVSTSYVESPSHTSMTPNSSFHSQRLSHSSDLTSSINMENHTNVSLTPTNNSTKMFNQPLSFSVTSHQESERSSESRNGASISSPSHHLSNIPPFPGTESTRSRQLESRAPVQRDLTSTPDSQTTISPSLRSSVFQSKPSTTKSLRKKMSSQFWKLIGYSRQGFTYREEESSVDETSNIVILNSLTHDQLLELLRDRYVSHPCLGVAAEPMSSSIERNQIFDSSHQRRNFALP